MISHSKILEWGLWALIAIAPIFFGSVHDWASLTICAAIFLILVFRPQILDQVKELPKPVLWGFSLVLVWTILQTIFFAVDSYKSAQENIQWIAFAIVFLVVQTLNRKEIVALAAVFMGIGLLISIYGCYQVYSGSEMVLWQHKADHKGFVTGTYLNRNHFAGLLQLCLGWLMGLWLAAWHQQKTGRVFLYGAIFVFCFFVLVKTGSRMGLLCFLAALTFLLFWLKNIRAGATILFVFFIGVILSLTLWLSWDFLSERFFHVDQSLESNEGGRIIVWKETLNMIVKYPLTGIGLGGFYWGYPAFQSEQLIMRWEHVHNDYLELAISIGLPACFVLLLSFIWIWISCLSKISILKPVFYSISWGGLVGVTSLAFHGLTDFNFAAFANMLLFVISLSMALRLINFSQQQFN